MRPERRARGARRVARGILCGASNVYDLKVFALLYHAPKLRGRNLLDLRNLEACLAPSLHASVQVAEYGVVAHARKTRHGLVNLRLRVCDDDDCRAQRYERARPACE